MLIGVGVHVEDRSLHQQAKSTKFTSIHNEEDIH